MSLSKIEQETFIEWNEQDENLTITSSSKATWNKLDKYGLKYRVLSLDSKTGKDLEREYSFNKKNVTIRNPNKKRKKLTEEQKERGRESLRKYREEKRAKND